MKRTKRSKLLAALLAITMVMTSLLPTVVFAADIDGEPTEPCTVTEGCTLASGHEGDCVLPDKPEEIDGPSVEEQLAALIAALPDPSSIDPLAEEQMEAIHNQLETIYAFAEESGIDVKANDTINAVIAVLYPAEPLNTTVLDENTMSGYCGADTSFQSDTYSLPIDGNGGTNTFTYYGNVTWSLTVNGTKDEKNTYKLKLSGTGDMADFGTSWSYGGKPYLNAVSTANSIAITEASSYVTELEIENGITRIGNQAFPGFRGLTAVSLPNSVTQVGTNAFNNCTSLTSVTFSQSLETIENSAFSYCSALTNIELPNNLKKLGNSVFSACSGLTGNIVIPDSVEEIGNAVFSNCTSIHGTLTLGKSVKTIGDSAFTADFTGTLTIPNSVTHLGNSAFQGAEFTELVLGNSLVEIGNYCFYTGVKDPDGKLVIPDSVTTIGEFAFSATEFASVHLGKGINSIGKDAFLNCTAHSLDATCLPTGFNGNNSKVFQSFAGNDTIYVRNTAQKQELTSYDGGTYVIYAITNGGTFAEDTAFESGKLATPTRKGYIFDGWYKDESFTGEAVTAPDAGKTYYAKWTEKIPDGTKEDPWDVSADGEGNHVIAYLEQNNEDNENPTYTLMISGTGAMADFSGNGSRGWNNYASQITSAIVEEGVTYIGSRTFQALNTCKTISLPASLTSLDDMAFGGIYGLESISVAAGNTSFKVVDGVLFSADGETLVKYPAEKTDTTYTIPAEVKTLGTHAFSGVKHLTNLTLPNGLTNIKAYALARWGDCSVTTLTIPNSVTTLDGNALAGPSSLTSVTIGTGITSLQDGVFSGCENLETVILPSTLTSIGKNAFLQCVKLKTIDLPDTVTEIGVNAFKGTGLTTVHIPASTTTIGNAAFYNGYTLGTETFSSSLIAVDATKATNLNSVGGISFVGMTSESIVYLPSSEKKTSLFTVGTYTTANTAFAVTNGGTFANNVTFSSGILESPIKGDYTFDGWYKDSSFSEENKVADNKIAYNDPDATAPSYPIYYAKWVSEITFDPNDGTLTDTTPITVEEDKAISTVSESYALPTPTRTGYTFKGWYTAQTGGDKVETSTVPTGNTTLYAQWTPNTYTINFDANGGNGTMDSQTVTYDTSIKLNENKFSKDGLCFAGWNTDSKADKAIYANGAEVKNLSAEDGATVTLYAIWTERVDQSISYANATVEKHINDGVFTNELTKTTVGGEISYISSNPSVATVNETTGEVTIVGAGSATITATAAETDTHKEAVASYTLTVTDHSFTNYVSNNDATCTEDGTKTATCDHGCGETDTIEDAGSAKGHSFGEWEFVNSPNCTDKGSKKRTCSECGTIETKDVDPNGHDWEDDFTIDKTATCTTDGSKSVHCKNCEVTKDSTVIPATGHSYGDSWKFDETNHWHECTDCGEKSEVAAHTFQWVTDKEATGTENGSRHEGCSVCGYKKAAVEIPATGTGGDNDKPSEPSKPNTDVPQTGDSSNMMLWFALLAVSAAGVGTILIITKKRSGCRKPR